MASLVGCSEPPRIRADSGRPEDAALDVSADVAGLCRAGAVRCRPDAPDTTQACADDGSGWIDGASCDVARGDRCLDGRCGNPCRSVGDSYLGCEYWPTVTANGGLASEFEFAIALASSQRFPVTVRVDGGGLAAPIVRTVMPNTTEVVRLPWVAALSQNQSRCCTGVFDTGPNCAARSTRVAGGAFHVVSDGPIAVYQFNPLEYRRGSRLSFSNDASLLLPQNVLGRQYLALSWSNEGPPIAQPADRCLATSLRGGYLAVVGAQASGTNAVSIQTTAPVWDPVVAGRVLPIGIHRFELARGEALMLVAQGLNADLTGTFVDAAQPVAVFSGHECASVPTTRPACDHLEEQLFPLATWGRAYAVSPVRYRTSAEPSTIRVMAQRDGVTLTFDGIATPTGCARTLARGQFCEFETAEGFRVTGSAPILVGQYLRGLGDVAECQCGGSTCPDLPQCVGDPALVLEAPVDQFRTSYRFLVPETYTQSFLNVVVADGADLDLDGNPLVGATDTPTGTGLITRTISIAPGSHQLRAVDGRTRFGIKVWGVAPYTSYAYPGGLDLAPIEPP